MATYGEVLGGALRFSVQPKRWLPLFILDSVFLVAIVFSIMLNMQGFTSLVAGATNTAIIMAILNYGVILLAGIAVWWLLKLWITGAVVHQSAKPKEFGRSFSVSKSKLLSLIVASVIVGVISGVVGLVPYIGIILSIVVGLMFFFFIPAIIVKNMSFDQSLSDSYDIFRKRPLGVFLMWLSVWIIASIIALIFMLPIIGLLFSMLYPLMSGISASNISVVLALVFQNWVQLLGAGLVFLVGLAISTAFSLKATTDFYLHIKKKRFGFV